MQVVQGMNFDLLKGAAKVFGTPVYKDVAVAGHIEHPQINESKEYPDVFDIRIDVGNGAHIYAKVKGAVDAERYEIVTQVAMKDYESVKEGDTRVIARPVAA